MRNYFVFYCLNKTQRERQTYNSNRNATGTETKPGSDIIFYVRVDRSYFTCRTCRVANVDTNTVISLTQ